MVAGLMTLVSAISIAGPAYAQDLNARLGDAESRATSAEVEINDAQARVDPAEARYVAITRRAVPARRAARSAQLFAHELGTELADRRQGAAAQISQIEARHEQEVDDHDEQVRDSLGFGLAALVVGLITLIWGWFRASAVVAWLTELRFSQAIGLCVFGGLVLLIIGAAMAAAGDVTGVIGVLLSILGFVLPVVLLLARHSAQVQRARAEPLLKRERLPMWVGMTIAAAMGMIVLIGFGTAIFTNPPEAELVSAQLRNRAAPARSGLANRRLAKAEAEAAELQEKASRLSAGQGAARRALGKVRQQLHRAKRELVSAQHDAQYYTRRIAAISAREGREAERHAQEDVEEGDEEATSKCDPNYTGCVPNTGYDVDCSEVNGPVEVIGTDVDRLDADGDGIGCEG